MTARHRGGGHKQQYRIVDFKREQGRRARQGRARSSTTRTATAASRCCTTSTARSATSSPRTASRSATCCRAGQGSEIRPGNALPLRYIPVGTAVHNVELQPGAGGKMARGAGTAIQLVAKEGDFATLRLPSTEMRRVPIDCRATVGEVGNAEAELIKIGKAGRNRWKGVRPQTRGVAMNPVDHPLGGGEGKTPAVATRCRRGASPRAAPATRASRPTSSSSAAAARSGARR